MDVVFNINGLAMKGLGATLVSLVRNCSDDTDLTLWFLCSELSDKDKGNIRHLLKDEGYQGVTKFVDFNAKETFGHLKSLHGDWTAYGRLLIPEIIKSDNALYLDSDLVINVDVNELKDIDTDKVLGAVQGGPVKRALENTFFIDKLKWDPEMDYFNSGVLFFNILSWKKSNSEAKLKELSGKYPNEFLSADQTLLNALCEGDFEHLSNKFNLAWLPNESQPNNSEKSIVHFVGSPKPWDISGKIVHQGYNTWKAFNTPFWESQYRNFTLGNLSRTWNIRRSIFKHLRKKLKS